MFEAITTTALFVLLFVSPITGDSIIAQHSLSLTNRYSNEQVNQVFADNIVLTLHFLKGDVEQGKAIDWEKIRQPFEVSFTLKPGETFAFQNAVLPEVKSLAATTNATFNYQQGFRSSGWLMGDGVCHLASFINMTAREAGLTVVAPTNHNFAVIPDIPAEYGTSIFYSPGNKFANAQQNLYIINNKSNPVIFKFGYQNNELKLTLSEVN